ncbi:MAG: toll/interleukin-1 receptor domain-containing protein [Desulfobacteraceae bacterium]|nr:toll/interleukin-1 receptor domain-containing protein [Desulfobacteraceae bacterium]
MPVFISYSHANRDFVDLLAAHLIKNKARVWVDRWELNVGDSIINKIQSAIEGSEAILVILSNASVESEWCKKELSSGILRELEEKRVVVLPVIIEDCEIPLFLRDKMYADFRKNFDEGLNTILDAIAKVTSIAQGRLEKDEYLTDWGMDWGIIDSRLSIRFTLVEHSLNIPYSILTEIVVIANSRATERYLFLEENDFGWFGRLTIIGELGNFSESSDVQFILEDTFPQTRELGIEDSKRGFEYNIVVSCRRLGEDNGKDIVYNYGNHFAMIRETIKKNTQELTKEESQRLIQLLQENPI